MQFYISKTNNKLNGKLFEPEKITKNICLNPTRRVRINNDSKILLDSGAFQDVRNNSRLTFQKALQRQLTYEDRIGSISELIVSYDRLVDEKFSKNVGQIKERVKFSTAEKYVQETIDAAKYLADQKSDLKPRIPILSCQGVTIEQYLTCLKEILKIAEPDDVIGFGGFCIVGMKPTKYEAQYLEIINKAGELIKKKGIKRVHIFGLGKFKLLVRTHIIFRNYRIEPSYDTSTYERNGIQGYLFNPYDLQLTHVFEKEKKYIDYHPRDSAILNLMTINQFWENLNYFYPIK